MAVLDSSWGFYYLCLQFEDPSFRVAPAPEVSHDTDTPSTNVPRQPGELSPLNGGAEDCDHLFFQCPLAQETWQSVNVDRLGIISTEVFWASLSGGFFRREADWGCIFAVLWAIWTDRNEVIVRGVNPSGDAIRYAMRGVLYIMVSRWHRPLILVTLI